MSSQPRLDFAGPSSHHDPNSEAEPALPAVATASSCPGCGEPFERTRKAKSHCSEKCKWLDWNRRNPRRREATGWLVPRPTPASPEARRDAGKAIAAANHSADLELARRLALEMLAAAGVGTISDLREYAAARGHHLPWHLPWTASVFLPPSKREAWFEPTGVRLASRHAKGNARKVNQYRLTEEGRAAYRAVRELMG